MKKLTLFFLLLTFHCFAIEQLPYCDPIAVWSFCKKYLPENPNVIECGACEGFDTVSMSQIWPNGKIYSFEPVPYLFSELKNRTKNSSNVHIYELALGDFCGKSAFYLSKHLNGSIAGSSSLLPPKEHLTRNTAVTFDDIIEVDVITLDKWASDNNVDHIDFMWLDMQGYELNMLKVSNLAKNAKVIYLEVEFAELYAGQYLYKDVLEWMIANNFELAAVDCDVNKKADFGNAIFIKK
jgi:2-O-methyltransferase